MKNSVKSFCPSSLSSFLRGFKLTSGGNNMRTASYFACIAVSLVLAELSVFGQSWQPPADSERCPSKWGAGDQRGSANHMKPDTVLRAARLIRTGELIELGRVLNSTMPLFGTR